MRHGRFVLIIVTAILLVTLTTGCVRRPSSRSGHSRSERVESPRRKSGRSSSSASLASRVQRLTNTIDRKSRSNSFTSSEFEEWTELYLEYSFEYATSTHLLSDRECESIEFNLGKIAGIIYNDQIVPAMEEIEEIVNGMEEYETRSQKWSGSAERGFESTKNRRRRR